MSTYPKRYCMPDGSLYTVSLEQVRADYASVVRQFDDLTSEEQELRIASMSETDADTWQADNWLGTEITTYGTKVGIDTEKRAQALERMKHSHSGFASELEVKSKHKQVSHGH